MTAVKGTTARVRLLGNGSSACCLDGQPTLEALPVLISEVARMAAWLEGRAAEAAAVARERTLDALASNDAELRISAGM